jgi:ribosomal protein S13
VPGIGSTAAKTVINETAATEPKKTAEEISEEESGEIVSFGEKTTPVNVPVPGIGSTAAKTVINETAATEPKKTAEEISEEESGEIVSFGEKTTPVNVPVPGTVVLDTGLGTKSVTDTLPLPKADPALTEKTTLEKLKDAAQIVSAASTLVPLITDAIGGGGGGGGTLPADTTRLNFTPNTLRSTLTGGIGGVGARYPYTPTTYGQVGGDQETEYLFFTKDPITGEASVQSGTPVTTTNTVPAAAPGKKEGGEIEDDMVKHLVEYHKNGGHQGPGQVKGIGSGQDDKIPAWLSDGEYVWSAQDVADLGDGSTDEGVRRLDKMRQMVRRQAGRKDVKKIAKPQKGIDTMLKAVGGLA